MALTALVANGQRISFKIKGSDTCLPLSQLETEVFMKRNDSSSISVTGGGSGVGFSALINGSIDIAQASRSMKPEEKIKMKDAGKDYKETVIAFDALAIVINKGNKIEQLTRDQLKGIFTGKISNWKEVGGADLKIIVYCRESSSGTYEFLKEHVMDNENYSISAEIMPATDAIIESVGKNEGAIGYVGLAYVEKSVKTVQVSFDGKIFVGPSIETAKNRTYPITRPLYYYYLTSTETKLKPYLDFVLSDEGQKIVLREGYVPLK